MSSIIRTELHVTAVQASGGYNVQCWLGDLVPLFSSRMCVEVEMSIFTVDSLMAGPGEAQCLSSRSNELPLLLRKAVGFKRIN